jgi:hypothetical protein
MNVLGTLGSQFKVVACLAIPRCSGYNSRMHPIDSRALFAGNRSNHVYDPVSSVRLEESHQFSKNVDAARPHLVRISYYSCRSAVSGSMPAARRAGR